MHGFQNIHCNADSNTFRYFAYNLFRSTPTYYYIFYVALLLEIFDYVTKYYFCCKNDKKKGEQERGGEIE